MELKVRVRQLRSASHHPLDQLPGRGVPQVRHLRHRWQGEVTSLALSLEELCVPEFANAAEVVEEALYVVYCDVFLHSGTFFRATALLIARMLRIATNRGALRSW